MLGAGGKMSDKTNFCIPATAAPDAGARDSGAQIRRDAGHPVMRPPPPAGSRTDAGSAPIYTDKVITDEDGCSVSAAGATRTWTWPLFALCTLALRRWR